MAEPRVRQAFRVAAALALLLGAGAAGAADDWPPPWPFAPVDFGGSVSVLWSVPESGTLESTGPGFGLTAGVSYRFHTHWAAELNLVYLHREYETPEWIQYFLSDVDDDMSLATTGLDLGLRAMYTIGRWDLFAGAGVGYYWSEMTVSGTVVGLPMDLDTEKDSGAGLRLSLGADLGLGPWRLGLEYRYLYLRGDFGDLSGGDVDIGGQQAALRLFYVWGTPPPRGP